MLLLVGYDLVSLTLLSMEGSDKATDQCRFYILTTGVEVRSFCACFRLVGVSLRIYGLRYVLGEKSIEKEEDPSSLLESHFGNKVSVADKTQETPEDAMPAFQCS